MKSNFLIISMRVIAVLILSLVYSGFYSSFDSGFLVYGASVENPLSQNITETMALESMNESEEIIKQMKDENFSTAYMEDLLDEANMTFARVKYAEILRGNVNSSQAEIAEARKKLSLITWKNINYSEVLLYTNQIYEREKQAFLIYDSILAAKMNIDKLSNEKINVAEAEDLLKQAETFFYQDLYGDANESLIKIRENLELKTLESATFTILQKGARNFFQKYWWHLLVFLIFFGLAGFFIYKKINLTLLKKRIIELAARKRILLDLMKKNQIERFKENKVSSLIYGIRMKKYKEKLNEINQELPVLEKKLKEAMNDYF